MADKEKRIENLAEEILQEYTNCYSEVDKEVLAKMIATAFEKISSADVVPKSEVERLQNEYEEKITELTREIEDLESTQEITPEAKYLVDTKADKIISLLTEFNKTQDELKQEVAREMFEDFQNILFSIMYLGNDGKYHLRKMSADKVTLIFEKYFELKKKYTGSEGKL